MKPGSIILFEPICRGSRLQILANTINAIVGMTDRPIKVVTRSDYYSPHLVELMGHLYSRIEFVTANTNLGGEWIKTLSISETKQMLIALEQCIGSSERADIVFMAIDEYLTSILPFLFKPSKQFNECRISAIKYRVEYLLPESRHGARNFLLNIITRFFLYRLNARLICFDERLEDVKLSGKPAAILPDPWFGDFAPSRRTDGRKKYCFDDNSFVVLALGRQDKRKGFHLVLGMLSDLFSNELYRLLIVGKINEEFANEFNAAKRRFPNKILHVDKFVDESELPELFASADTFILPYSADFTASSGTLPRAASSGVPVVSSDHGLVGYRVSNYRLGEVFNVANPNGLFYAIETVRTYTTEKRKAIAEDLNSFSLSSSLDEFKKKVSLLFN